MTGTLAPVAALLSSVAILLMGNGLQGTLLPVRAQLEAFSSVDIGALGSAYYVGFAAGCLLGPHVIQRVGHIRAFTAVVSLASTTVLGHALLLNAPVWWLLRAVTGFCFASLFMIIESWLNERSTNETRGVVFSVYTIINLTVVTLGQMMLLLYDPGAFPLFALASILVSLAAIPVALTLAPAPAPLATVRIRPKHLYRLSPVGFVGCFCVGLGNGSFWALAPIFAQQGPGDVVSVTIFMSVAVLAGAAGQWPLGRASDRMDRRKVIAAACGFGCLAGLGLIAANHYWSPGVFLLACFYGAAAFPLYSLCAAHMNDFVAPDGFVEASSGLLLLFAGGAVIGPMIASTLMGVIGKDGLFAFTALVHVVLAGFAIYRMRLRDRPPEEDRAQFDDAIRIAQTVSEIKTLSGEVRDERNDQRVEDAQSDAPTRSGDGEVDAGQR